MNNGEFHSVIDNQIKTCVEILDSKASEYAEDGDRLHNFKVAAKLQDCSVRQALAGMMAKHTISIYDLCRSNSEVSKELWDEKITDSINYLLLLKASLVDAKKEQVSNYDECKEILWFCVECEKMNDCPSYSMNQSSGCFNGAGDRRDRV